MDQGARATRLAHVGDQEEADDSPDVGLIALALQSSVQLPIRLARPAVLPRQIVQAPHHQPVGVHSSKREPGVGIS
jgi:hypothetical protein